MVGIAGRSLLLLALTLGFGPAAAQDAPGGPMPGQAVTSHDWSGFYLGYHSGGALGLADVGDPYGKSIFGDTVRTPGALAGGQLGYNWQRGSLLYGVEADASLAEMDGTNTCFGYSGFALGSNCRSEIKALGTLSGRLGWVLPFDGRTLVYGKAGLAFAHYELAAKPNGGLGLPASRESDVAWGWTIGGGLERALTPRWSVKAEYGYLSFDESFRAPASLQQTAPPSGGYSGLAGAGTDNDLGIHQFKLGMNYKLGAPAGDFPDAPSAMTAPGGYVLTLGTRYVYGWGQFHKDLGLQKRGLTSLASRLTYENESTHGWEGFARLDTPFRGVVKGMIGGGSSGGQLNDEDWDLPFGPSLIPYSNTISAVDNDVRYGFIDVGYALRKGQRYSVSPFIGYTQFRQNMAGLGCRQIANPNSDCGTPIPTNVVGITEDDVWEGLRLGSSVEVEIAPRIHFTGDFAYLPYVSFEGMDDHRLRNLVSPESGDGVGVQLEAILSYDVTKALSLGIGGRYWSMWTTDGDVDFGGTGTTIPMRYASEQAQLLVQGAYKFGGRKP
ncbi:outer membrane beta-barrel protein [Methyloligella sp. 2.7D]|uniref:outer membrane beta-barrel protein n=1 Tax=unclassified Methyloligella TaxID=2625955 RepID=UPI00157C9AB7|nr:outer membrane beta-barrel protein [Methyloligella sp. GL2]QKP76053.1 outer membrane beta-barrel protein [Methyloligella sp. GL2]